MSQIDRIITDSSVRIHTGQDFIHRKVAGNDILISVGNNVADFNGYIELNESASFVWDLMNTPCSYNSLVINVMERFNISKEVAEKDISDFLEQLLQHEMIEVIYG